jgi:hypothetical protein
MRDRCGVPVICGNLADGTFARFRAEFAGAIGEFFAQVLMLCARAVHGHAGHDGRTG